MTNNVWQKPSSPFLRWQMIIMEMKLSSLEVQLKIKSKKMAFRESGGFFNQTGFTLIETLVAFMILAISLVVVMQLFSGGLKSNKLSSDYLYGIFHAKEKMEELLLSENMLAENLSGDFGDGYSWQATIDFIESEDETDIPQPLSAFDITLDVSWRYGIRDKHFKIKTVKLSETSETEGQLTE
jgi:general secretion pathway protein I